jgi:hypothetical protein
MSDELSASQPTKKSKTDSASIVEMLEKLKKKIQAVTNQHGL